MGIQLDRTYDAKIYTKDDGDDWLYAKTHVQSADSNIHEWVNHLGKTHLTFEPRIIAIHNTLKMKKHKRAPFFAPLVKDTLFLNCKFTFVFESKQYFVFPISEREPYIHSSIRSMLM